MSPHRSYAPRKAVPVSRAIRNLVIILSAWAVIKVPMLLNEMKFLGPRFMMIRWTLSVLAILIVSSIAARIVRDADLPAAQMESAGLHVDRDACIECGICARSASSLFEMDRRKANVRSLSAVPERDLLQKAMDACSVKAIRFHGEDTALTYTSPQKNRVAMSSVLVIPPAAGAAQRFAVFSAGGQNRS